MRRRLGDADVTRNNGFIDLLAEVRAHVAGDEIGELVAFVEHGEDDALDTQMRIKGSANPIDGPHQMADAFESEEFALQRDEHGMRGGERIQGEQPERRRTVDQDVIAGGVDVGQRLPKERLRPSSPTSSTSAPDRSTPEGTTKSFGTRVGRVAAARPASPSNT